MPLPLLPCSCKCLCPVWSKPVTLSAVAAVPSPAELSTEHIRSLSFCCCWEDYTPYWLYMTAVTRLGQIKKAFRQSWKEKTHVIQWMMLLDSQQWQGGRTEQSSLISVYSRLLLVITLNTGSQKKKTHINTTSPTVEGQKHTKFELPTHFLLCVKAQHRCNHSNICMKIPGD